MSGLLVIQELIRRGVCPPIFATIALKGEMLHGNQLNLQQCMKEKLVEIGVDVLDTRLFSKVMDRVDNIRDSYAAIPADYWSLPTDRVCESRAFLFEDDDGNGNKTFFKIEVHNSGQDDERRFEILREHSLGSGFACPFSV